MSTPTDFGRLLRELRERRGVSKAALARELKASWSTVNNWELHGALPERGNLRLIATALRLKPEERQKLLDLAEREEHLADSDTGVRLLDSVPPTSAPAAVSATRPSAPYGRLEELLTRALVPGRHTIVDAGNVLAALAEASFLLDEVESEPAAGWWLDAAAELRRRGIKCTGSTIAVLAVALATRSGTQRTI